MFLLHIETRRDILVGNKENRSEELKEMKLKTISLATVTLVMVLAFAVPVQATDFGPVNIQVGISVGNKWISYPTFHTLTFTGDSPSTTVQIATDKTSLYVKKSAGLMNQTFTEKKY